MNGETDILYRHARRVLLDAPEALGSQREALVLVDKDKREIGAFESDDEREFVIWVAGPAAWLVSKLHKLAVRKASPDRLSDKDALDVFRLLVTTETDDLAIRIQQLIADSISTQSATSAIGHLINLFGDRTSPGIDMLVRAVTPLEDSDVRSQACLILVSDLLDVLGMRSRSHQAESEGWYDEKIN